MTGAKGAPDLRTVEEILLAACRAPSIHNSQPWRWQYDGRVLDLHADWSRQLRHGDPDGRDLEISCGAALHHAVTAARALGWSAQVTRTPDPLEFAHLARIAFHRSKPNAMHEVLHEAVYERYTDRRTPSSMPVSEDQLDGLVRAATRYGARVTLVRSRDDRALVHDLRQLSVILQHDDESYLEEFAQWVHSTRRDGVPDGSTLAQRHDRSRYNVDTRFPTGSLRDQPPDGEVSDPTWALLSTSSDDTLSRLRAGEALSAILLRATVMDLAVVPYTQAVEVAVTRERLEERLLDGAGCLQVILRIGHPVPGLGPVPRTRRRPLHDVFTEVLDGSRA